MNPTYYFGIIIRLFAIALFIYGVGKAEILLDFSSHSEYEVRPSTAFSVVKSILPIFISIILWLFPITIARKVLPPTNEQVEAISPSSMLTVFLIALGVYSLYYVLSDFAYWITLAHIFVKDEYGNISKVLTNQDKASIFAAIIEFVIAIVFIAKAKTISSKLIRFSK